MARERVNQMLASEMSLMRLVVIASISGGEAFREFKKTIDRLQG
jgi:hypothetical protein